MHLHLPPWLAAFLTLGFMAFLFRRDIRQRPNISGALWLPLIWFLITCTRPVSAWLNIFGISVTGAVSLEEGSRLDACFWFVMIVCGIYVLKRRQVRLGEICRENGWLTAFLFYALISVSWSDFPYVAFKRWIKIIGDIMMVLIVL